MERHAWQKVVMDRNSREPSPRWGHCSVALEDEIVHFGGYADSNYMSDVWSFNTRTLTWIQHKTTGAIPSPRSNCTVHYQRNSDRIVVFGGGGPNKKRFNTISLLDWGSKNWREIVPKENEKAPWQRTYHSSELLYPYLIVFGGQGIADLDDVWVFNLQTEQWSEIILDKNKAKPCARRFHTSVVLGNSFYVIGGCHGKYRCLSDIWSVDFTDFLENGRTDRMQWKDLKLNGSSFLTRWGHTSVVFDEKIYVFGGRFSNDLQDILIIDPQKESLKTMKVVGEVPKARRRHSALFLGSCMLIFGGFNGEYFNDMYYINVFDLRPKLEMVENTRDTDLLKWVGRSIMADARIVCDSGKYIPVHRGLIMGRFRGQSELTKFIDYVQDRFSEQQVRQILQILYSGAGRLPTQLSQFFQINLADTICERNNASRKMIDPDLVQSGLLVTKSRSSHQVVVLSHEKYGGYLQRNHQMQHYDLLVAVGKECIPVNRTMLAVNSQYFEYLLRDHRGEVLEIGGCEEFGDARVFQVMLNYLQSGYLVVPEGLDEKCWILLYHLAEYLCLNALRMLCEGQLIALLTQENCSFLLDYSVSNKIEVLSLHSGDLMFRKLLEKGEHKYLIGLKEKNEEGVQGLLSQLLVSAKFDLLQLQKRRQRQLQDSLKSHGGSSLEKENNAECFLE